MDRLYWPAAVMASITVVTGARAQSSCDALPLCSPTAVFSADVCCTQFGTAVDLRGDQAIVGAYQECAGDSCGAAYIFRSADGWTEEARLSPFPPELEDGFGWEVAIDGEWAMVGHPYLSCNGQWGCGAVYIFRRVGSQWTPFLRLTRPELGLRSYFGRSIAIRNNWAAVGMAEAVHLYEFNGATWIHRQTLTTVSVDFPDFGQSVAMDVGRLVVGAPNRSEVHFYELVGSFWYTDGIFGASGWGLGQNVSLSGDFALAGMSGFDCPGDPNCGTVFRYRRAGTDWVYVGTMAPEVRLDSEFTNQTPTAVSSDWAVIGNSNTVFHRNSEDQWVEMGRLGAAGAELGKSIAIDGDRILIGFRTGGIGSAFLFNLSEPDSDCNCDGRADTCDVLDGVGDCQENGVLDTCDIGAGFSVDCGGDLIPDECQLDCQPNGVEDSCDLAVGSPDCNANAIPDECEFTYLDCNQNSVPDDCETEDESMIPTDCSCIPTSAPLLEPTGPRKNRFVSFSPGNPGHWKAIRVKLISLHHVDPPYTGSPSVPFTALEGEVRWVGPPDIYIESSVNSNQFYASMLQCDPHFQDWSSIDTLHVTGSAIVPSSTYHVQFVAANCDLDAEESFSAPLTIYTSRWGDIIEPLSLNGESGQPDLADIAAALDKFRNLPLSKSKVYTKLSSMQSTGEILIQTDLGFSHISVVVDAFRGSKYPYNIADCP